MAQKDLWRPLHIGLVLSADEITVDGSLYIARICDWPRFARLPLHRWLEDGRFRVDIAPPPPPAGRASTWNGAAASPNATSGAAQYNFVVKTCTEMTSALAVSLTVNHVAYHCALGITGHLVNFRQTPIFGGFVRDHTIQSYVQEG